MPKLKVVKQNGVKIYPITIVRGIWDTDNNCNLSDTLQKIDTGGNAFATCSTAGDTAAKVATIQGVTGWRLVAGAEVTVKYANTNTAENPTLNVNGTGAKSIWYDTALISTTDLGYAGTANRPIKYVYDGTQWVFVSWAMAGAGEDTEATEAMVRGIVTNYANATSAEGNIISVASGTTALSAQVSKYYKVAGTVTTMAITLPVPADNTRTEEFNVQMTLGANPTVTLIDSNNESQALTFSSAAGSTYRFYFLYNGEQWIVSYHPIS